LFSFVREHGSTAYRASEFKERYYVLWWLAFNLCRPRHLRQRQLLILGRPGTKKTNFVQALSEFLDVYFVPRRPKDFTGANKEYDLWVIDEVSGYELDVDTLNMILDGQKMSLDSKYGRVFEKKRNVPIILLGNTLPYTYNTDSFNSRVFEVHFFSDCPPIDPLRLSSTLFTLCMRYSIMSQSPDEPVLLFGKPVTSGDFSLGFFIGSRSNSQEDIDAIRRSPLHRERLLRPFTVFGELKDQAKLNHGLKDQAKLD
jgi:hypothetical protein